MLRNPGGDAGRIAGSKSVSRPAGQCGVSRGDYDAALDWYRKSLAIEEQLGDRAGMATSYHQLGMVAQDRGDYDAALDWYRKSLAINEQLGNRAGMAASYHQLGIVAQDRGDYDAALDWYRKSLAIKEQLGNRAGMATSYHQLGIVAQLAATMTRHSTGIANRWPSRAARRSRRHRPLLPPAGHCGVAPRRL